MYTKKGGQSNLLLILKLHSREPLRDVLRCGYLGGIQVVMDSSKFFLDPLDLSNIRPL